MPHKQPFNDFLNSPGPSTPRGRGRGGSRGGGSGPSRAKSDYSNVPFNYEAINRQGYVKLEGYSVAPFGGTINQPHTPDQNGSRGRGGYTPRGRGRGRGFGSSPFRGGHSVHTPPSGVPFGSATPVTGLGYQKGKQADRSTVGKGGVVWGGGMAPMFVKAGELFKDGEVDVITVDVNQELHVEQMSLSDPSAPQMTDLRDDTEVEVFDVDGLDREQIMEGLDEIPDSAISDNDQDAKLYMPSDGHSVEEVAPEIPVDVEDDPPSFFIDTDPAPIVLSSTSYESVRAAPLGTSAPALSEEETIVFKPRTYKKPEPIFVAQDPIEPKQQPVSTSSPRIPPHAPAAVWIDPRARTRSEKKAAKRDKRGQKKKKPRRRGMVIEGSDIEWGSDGPPPEIMAVHGLDDEDGMDEEGRDGDEVEVLRDYLAGTLLNAKMEQAEREEEGSDDDSEVAKEMEKELKKRFGEGGGDAIELLTEEGQENGLPETGDDAKEVGAGEEGDEGDWESSSGSSSSADIRNMKAVLEDASESEDEEDDDDEVDRFAGKDSWDETDWFIRNMEEALDGTGVSMRNRKQRNQLFNTIQNGDFDDFWPTAPAKKAKNKHVPAELHNQWEKDRQKKAEKKRQRQLDRLAAELDPYPASRKGKGKSKAHQASLAHLIPASATEVADMFDISSDEEEMMMMGNGRGRSTLLPKSLEQIDADICLFLAASGKNTYSLPPMDKEGRKKIHMLAECYGLKSKSRGKGKNRFTVLIKTSDTGILIDEIKISRLVSASASSGGGFYKSLYSRSGKPGKGGKGGASGKVKKAGGGGGGGGGGGVRHREGDQVGEGAERIGGGNIGHQMLSRMGWAEGDRIGRTGGLDNPIVAIVKNTKTGLGA